MVGRPSENCFIYGLRDPEDGRLRYIGKANDPRARFKGHLRDRARRNTPLYSWMRKLAKDGREPVLTILRECSQSDWQEEERQLIAEHRKVGRDLLNVADGGDAPFCASEVRAANGKKVAAIRVATPTKKRIYELKREMGRLLKQGRVSEENKAKLRLAAQRAPHLFGEWASL